MLKFSRVIKIHCTEYISRVKVLIREYGHLDILLLLYAFEIFEYP
jgi:hypothetical protein